MGDVAAVANGMSVDPAGNIVVGDGDGPYFVNEQASGSLSLYGLTIQHQSAAVVAGSAQGGTDCSMGAANTPANSLFFQSAEPFIDGSDNMYFSDNEIGGVNGGGSAWVLPATSGSLDGMSVTAGNVYKLAGNGGTSAPPDACGRQRRRRHRRDDARQGRQRRPGRPERPTSAPPALQVLAQSTCTSSCAYGLASTTAGDIYTIAGGPANVLATLSGPTSVLSDGTGNLFFTDGATSSANLDELTGGPTLAAPTVSFHQPDVWTRRRWHERDHHRHRAHRRHGGQVRRQRGKRRGRQQRHVGDGDLTGGHRDGRRHGHDTGWRLGDLGRRPLHLRHAGRADGHRRQPDVWTGGRRHEHDHHRHRAHRASAVKFGTNAATGVVVNSATSVTATSPAGTGTVDVTVTTANGTSATSAADHFTYVAPAAPTITAVSPTSGPAAGGTSVTITGTGLTGATAVKFGTNAATGVVVNSATSVTATSPAGTGTVDVTVTTANGTSATSAADHFTYVAQPHRRSPPSARRLGRGRQRERDHHRHRAHRGHGGQLRRQHRRPASRSTAPRR